MQRIYSTGLLELVLGNRGERGAVFEGVHSWSMFESHRLSWYLLEFKLLPRQLFLAIFEIPLASRNSSPWSLFDSFVL
jgi:hypothetical protein